ncbi:MAG: hypothetical protein ABIK73_06065 [candidate division WOR-3 bacterium]
MIEIVLYGYYSTEKYLALEYKVSSKLYLDNGEARSDYYLELIASKKENKIYMSIELDKNCTVIKLHTDEEEETALITSEIIINVKRYSVELIFEGTEEQLEKLRNMLKILQQEYRNRWDRY